VNPQFIRLCYGNDRTLEIHLDTTDFFIDGDRGNFAARKHRDFIVEVARHAPKTATFRDLIVAIHVSRANEAALFKKLVYEIKERFKFYGLEIPVLESVRSEGYRLAEGWAKLQGEPKHPAFGLLENLGTALQRSRDHVGTANIATNSIGLQHVERSAETLKIARENYFLVESVGWELLDVLSSCGITNEDHPRVLEVKRKIEKVTSYALFWRVGDSLPQDKWRRDFHSESTTLEVDIKNLIERILRTAADRKRAQKPSAESE
jgi:hypothetical protein